MTILLDWTPAFAGVTAEGGALCDCCVDWTPATLPRRKPGAGVTAEGGALCDCCVDWTPAFAGVTAKT